MRKKGLPAGKDFKPGASEVERSLRINFNDRIIKMYTAKHVNDWKPIPECEHRNRQQVGLESSEKTFAKKRFSYCRVGL
jgi:hypothetical protein